MNDRVPVQYALDLTFALYTAALEAAKNPDRTFRADSVDDLVENILFEHPEITVISWHESQLRKIREQRE